MEFKVKHNELKQTTDTFLSDSDILSSEIDNMLKYTESLRTIWQGIDSDAFYNNIYNYLNRMKIIPEALNTIGQFVGEVNGLYEEADEDFAKDLNSEKGRMLGEKNIKKKI